MSNLDNELKEKLKIGKLQRQILLAVGMVGFLAVGLLAPNVLGALAKMGILPTRRQDEVIKKSRDLLIRRGLLEYRSQKLSLTKKGERVMRDYERTNFHLPAPKIWDRKWRVLIFDISESKKYLRDKVRSTLIAVGFFRLQDSVWIYPYACEDFITLLKADFKIGKELLYMIVDSLEHDQSIKEHFNLV